jgi:RES domain-containing protein
MAAASTSSLAVPPEFVQALHATWRQTPRPPELAAIGDRFARRRRDAILIVPSALAPGEANWLLNPDHLDFGRIRIHSPERFT